MNTTQDTLISKYNVPAPRYTSYPTVPYWQEQSISMDDWKRSVIQSFKETNDKQGISIYIHLPYCESLCTYCACNTRITKNHGVEQSYIDTLIKEWQQYLAFLPGKPKLRELHLGGGTPTFFSPEHLKRLMEVLLDAVELHDDYCFSFEGHPNNTTQAHLEMLYSLGFRRVSFGIQDFDEKVQTAINRKQPYEEVTRVVREAREVGYEGINFDLIYGLPFQSPVTIADTFKKTLALKPDRIAYYSYAHVPWKHRGQRAYDESHLPTDAGKRALYEKGSELLQVAGYFDIGMDHFGLKGDPLVEAFRCKTLHRNFMGYTTNPTALLIGLGASAISDAQYGYTQNAKHVEDYKAIVQSGKLPLTIGHHCDTQDRDTRALINDILCKGEVIWKNGTENLDIDTLIGLHTMAEEGLVKVYDNGFRVTEAGMAFVRNICMLFDQYISNSLGKENQFSKAI